MRWHLACIVVQLAIGCNSVGIEQRFADRPPETRVTSGPPDSTSAWSYRVHFQWMGTDPDGTVDHFEYVLAEHPAVEESILAGATHRVEVRVPERDDPRWRRVSGFDSTFVVSADSLRLDPRGGDPAWVRRQYFERWHTFFLRAVDDRGLADPTPDYRMFNARTLAPTVALVSPVTAGSVLYCPPFVEFHWTGEDPIDAFQSQPPDSARWVALPTCLDLARQPPHVDFPDSLYSLRHGYRWSLWRSWSAPDGSGRQAILRNLRPREGSCVGYYIFAVQAKDEAGAVTPVFDWTTPGKNNVALVIANGGGGPYVRLREPSLGAFGFQGPARAVQQFVVSGQLLSFRWSADADGYGGSIDAYRYGWDIVDPSLEESWEQGWSPSVRAATPRSFQSGIHRFLLEVRDDLGSISRAEVDLEIHVPTRSRELLLVDDSVQPTALIEQDEDRRWLAVIDSLAARVSFGFDAARDVYDVANDHHGEPPSVGLLLDYRTIAWTVRATRTHWSALKLLTYYIDPFVMSNTNLSPLPPNSLNLYLDNGGKLWVSGRTPASEAWGGRSSALPVDVRGWQRFGYPTDPDSLGVTTWLYRMGVSSFDLGSGPMSQRPSQTQDCRGFWSAVAGAPELAVDPARWDEPPGSGARPNVEIYNVSGLLVGWQPVVPPRWMQLAPYTYQSITPENPTRGVVYPITADRQPALLMVKGPTGEAVFSRAICGFEPYMLTPPSHVALARYVLLDQMGLGRPAVP
jgi:hypothetical protein